MSPPKGSTTVTGDGHRRQRQRAARGAGRAIARSGQAPRARRSRRVDLSLPQYRVLALLGDGSTASSWLADRLTVSPPSVTAVVDGLVARGLVERTPDPADRRRLNLVLTADGRRAPRRRRRRGQRAARRDRRALRRQRRRRRGHGLEEWHPRSTPTATSAKRSRRRGERRPMTMTSPNNGARRARSAPTSRRRSCRSASRRATRRRAQHRARPAAVRGCARVIPVLLAHKWIFVFSLVASFLGLAVQVQIPTSWREAIDDGLDDRHGDARRTSSTIIVGARGVRFVAQLHVAPLPARRRRTASSTTSGTSCTSTSAACRSRSTTGCSRASSSRGPTPTSARCRCSWRSRRSSSCSAASPSLAFVQMLTINVPLAFVAMSTMPFVVFVGVRMRKRDVPGVVARSRRAWPTSPPSSTRTSTACAS